MELFNIGPLELLFLAALAVIILGPQRAAEIAGQLGRLLASLRRDVNSVRTELTMRLDEETKPLRETRTTLQETADTLHKLDQEQLETGPTTSNAPLSGTPKGPAV